MYSGKPAEFTPVIALISYIVSKTPLIAGATAEPIFLNTTFIPVDAPAISGVFETMYEIKAITGVNSAGLPEYTLFPDHTAFSYIFLTGMAFLVISIIFTLFMKVPRKESNLTNQRNS